MIAEDSVSWFVRDTKVQLSFYVLFSTLRVLLATDSGIKSSAHTDKKTHVSFES